jgi:nitroreductase
MIGKEALMESLYFRHACKIFDEKKIPKEDLEFVLEVGRLSPSSFGMEHWRFVVVQDAKLKIAMRPFCWDQKQVTTCSDLIVIVSKTDKVVAQEYSNAMFMRRGLTVEHFENYITRYTNFTYQLSSIKEWSLKQCYLAAANMMSYGAMVGIDSCPIEGFEKEPLEELLGIGHDEDIALLVPFGYRINPQTPKFRLSFEEIVEYR